MRFCLAGDAGGRLEAGLWGPGKMAVQEATAHVHPQMPALQPVFAHTMEKALETTPFLEKRKDGKEKRSKCCCGKGALAGESAVRFCHILSSLAADRLETASVLRCALPSAAGTDVWGSKQAV